MIRMLAIASMHAMVLALTLLTVACAANNRVETASGSPEVTIAGVKPDQVKPILVNAVLNRGLRIRSDSPFLLVVEKETTNLAASFLLSSRYDSRVAERTSFSIAEVLGGTRIVADATFVTNAGSGFELNAAGRNALNTPELQGFLDEVAAAARVQQSPPSRPTLQKKP